MIKLNNSDIKEYILNNRDILLMFGTFLLLTIVLFHNYIFGDNVYIFTDVGADTINSYYPRYLFYRQLWHSKLEAYSFSNGMGSGTFSYVLFDPFSFFLYFMPEESLSSGIIYSIILKLFFLCYTSYKFIEMLLTNEKKIFLWLASLTISFSGFFILWGQHYQFSSTYIYLPLYLYCFELFLQKKKLFPIVFATLPVFLTFYIGYQIMIFSSIYFCVRIFSLDAKMKLKDKFKTFLLIAGLVSIGLLLSSIFILPQFQSLINNPRISTSQEKFNLFSYFTVHPVSWIKEIYLRLFSNNILGDANTFFGQSNYYELPQVYTTLLFLLMLPQSFFSKRKELKILSIVLFIFVLALFLSPFLPVVFNGFQYPMYRWGMFTTVSVSLIGAIGILTFIKEYNKTKLYVLISTAIVLLSLLLTSISTYPENNFSFFITKTIVFFIVYIFVFYFFRNKNNYVYIFILLLTLIDLSTEHYQTINSRTVLTKTFEEDGKYYFDANKEIISEINNKDSSFFRIAKSSYSQFLNDAMAQNYNGVSCYGGIGSLYNHFLNECNVMQEFPHVANSYSQFNNRDILNDMLSVRYFVSNTPIENMTLILKNKDRYLYRRNNSFPFGVTYNSYLIEDSIDEHFDEIFLNTLILAKPPKMNIKEINDASVFKDKTEKIDGKFVISKENLKLININKIGDDLYVATNNDPMIIISDLDTIFSKKGKIEFKLYSHNKNFIQLFWAERVDQFSENSSSCKNIDNGISLVSLPYLSLNPINELRIDPINTIDTFKIFDISLEYEKEVRIGEKEKIKYKQPSYVGIERTSGEIDKTLKISTLSNDPQINISLDTILNNCSFTVSFSIKSNISDYCQLFWKNNNEKYFSETKSKVFKTEKDKRNEILFSINNANIKDIRIDPSMQKSETEINNLELSFEKLKINAKENGLFDDTLQIKNFAQDKILGHLDLKENKILFLPIQYSPDWEVKIDGIHTETIVANYGFIGVPVEKGSHEVLIEYSSKNLRKGLIYSLFASIIIVLLKYRKEILNFIHKKIFYGNSVK